MRREKLGTVALYWMISFLKAPVGSGYFIGNLKNAVWKCPVCISHSVFLQAVVHCAEIVPYIPFNLFLYNQNVFYSNMALFHKCLI